MARLPVSQVLASKPSFTLRGQETFELNLDAPALKRDLHTWRGYDRVLPAEWNGARITVRTGPTAIAEWKDIRDQWSGKVEWSSISLAQSPLPIVTMPPGFPRAEFIGVVFGTRGFAYPDRIRALLANQAVLPELLFDIDRARFFHAELNLKSGRAALFEDLRKGDAFIERIGLLRSAGGSAYKLQGTLSTPFGLSSLEEARAVANLVDLADTIP